MHIFTRYVDCLPTSYKYWIGLSVLSVNAVFKEPEAILLITAKIAQRTAAVATERAIEANYV